MCMWIWFYSHHHPYLPTPSPLPKPYLHSLQFAKGYRSGNMRKHNCNFEFWWGSVSVGVRLGEGGEGWSEDKENIGGVGRRRFDNTDWDGIPGYFFTQLWRENLPFFQKWMVRNENLFPNSMDFLFLKNHWCHFRSPQKHFSYLPRPNLLKSKG